jgi:putative membrane protein
MLNYRSVGIAVAVACALGCGGGDRNALEGGGGRDGFGDDAGRTPSERTGSLSAGALSTEDRRFVQQASQSNELEVSLGNLAEDKAQRDEVKQFGEQLARDHQAANRELQSSLGDATTADRPGAAVSNLPDRAADVERAEPAAMQQTRESLERVTGASFDRAYLEEMVKHHEHDIQQFERAAQSENPQVRAFAERTLPTLREHLQRARELQQSIAQSGAQR